MALDIMSFLIGKSLGGVQPSGALEITENGTYDVTTYASADVNVAGDIPLKNKLIYYNDFNGHTNIKDGYTVELLPSGTDITTEDISVANVNSTKCMTISGSATTHIKINKTDTTPIDFTFGGWFYQPSSIYTTPLQINYDNNSWIRMYVDGGYYNWDKPSSWTEIGKVNTSSNKWAHYTLVCKLKGDNPYIECYLNSYPVGTIYGVESINSLLAGDFGRTVYHPDKMTSIFFAEGLLSTAEIKELMTSTEIFT